MASIGDAIATVSELMSGVVGAAAAVSAAVLTGIAVFRKNPNGTFMLPQGTSTRKMLVAAFALEIIVLAAGVLAVMVGAGWFGASRGRTRVPYGALPTFARGFL
jgi:hypothetical protein